MTPQLTGSGVTTQIVTYVTMIAVYWWISSVCVTLLLVGRGIRVQLSPHWECPNRYDGQVMVLLPFEPMSFFQGISHRNLGGDNFYEASVVRSRMSSVDVQTVGDVWGCDSESFLR